MEELNTSPTSPKSGAATPAADQTAEETNSPGEITPGTQASGTAAGDGVQPNQAAPPDRQNVQDAASGQTRAPQTEAANQPQQPQPSYHLPPGYAVDPATGQVVFVGPVMQQPVAPGYVQPGIVYTQPQPTPEQIAAQQAAAQQRYGQIINSVEQFLEGEATVSDVVKTLYTNAVQDNQLWKGVIVGAAAAVLLTSEPVREAMGKTFGGLFPGLKQNQQSTGGTTAAAPNTTTATATETPTTDKE